MQQQAKKMQKTSLASPVWAMSGRLASADLSLFSGSRLAAEEWEQRGDSLTSSLSFISERHDYFSSSPPSLRGGDDGHFAFPFGSLLFAQHVCGSSETPEDLNQASESQDKISQQLLLYWLSENWESLRVFTQWVKKENPVVVVRNCAVQV